jgi:hypothetical protein
MAGRYVPPAMRPRVEGKEDVYITAPSQTKHEPVRSEDNQLFATDEVRNYLWRGEKDESRFSRIAGGNQTMHDSIDAPGKLANIFLFTGANPR